jgi:hypothetical protein
MHASDEQKVMQAFYDRIFQMVTYNPNQSNRANQSVFDARSTLVQLARDGSLEVDTFKNMVTPINPRGDLNASRVFFDLTDAAGGTGVTYSPAGKIAATYKTIVDGADSAVTMTPEQQKKYQQARSYLYKEVTQTGPFGDSAAVPTPTPTYTDYLQYSSAYVGALRAYRSAYLTYDLTKPQDQRSWEALAPVLDGNITTAWDNWLALGDKSGVEEALAYLAASDNNIVANVISDAQQDMLKGGLEATSGSGDEWYLSYGSPVNWYDPSETDGWMSFSLNSNYLYTSDDSSWVKSQGSAGSDFLGLISWGGSAGYSKQTDNHHLEADNLSITADMMTVTIVRPWLSDILFKLQGWYLAGQDIDCVSDGKLDTTDATLLLPVIPTAFVMVRNVSITANWTTQDSKAVTTAISSSGGFSFGPFHAGGGGGSGSSHSSSSSTFIGGTLTIPDPQIVAWINEIVPACPPLSGKR